MQNCEYNMAQQQDTVECDGCGRTVTESNYHPEEEDCIFCMTDL